LESLISHIHAFKPEIIVKGIIEVQAKAIRCSGQQEYTKALALFHICLLFGLKQDQHGNLFNIACTYLRLKEKPKAIEFFGYCKTYLPESQISIQAKTQLDKLEQQMASRALGYS
jgi:Zn-finger domain-containing protein